MAGRDRSKWTLELKNKGGEAFQVEVFTTQFNSVKIFGDKARLATHESRTVYLNGLLPLNDGSLVRVECLNVDNEKYRYDFKLNENEDSIMSVNSFQKGILVESEESEYNAGV